MSAFYADMQATGVELLNEFGALVEFKRKQLVPVDELDPGGPQTENTLATGTIYATVLPLNKKTADRLRASDSVTGEGGYLIAQGQDGFDIRRGDMLTWNGKQWVVLALAEWMPDNATSLLWEGVVQS